MLLLGKIILLIGCCLWPIDAVHDRTWWQKVPHGGFGAANWSSSITSLGNTATEPIAVQTSASAPRLYRKVKKTFRSIQFHQAGDQAPQVKKTSWSQEESLRNANEATTANELEHDSLRFNTQASVGGALINQKSNKNVNNNRVSIANNDVFGPTGKVHWDDEQDYTITIAPHTQTTARRQTYSSSLSLPLPIPSNPSTVVPTTPPSSSSSSSSSTAKHSNSLPSPASSNQAFGSKLSRPIDVFNLPSKSSAAPFKSSSKSSSGKRRAASKLQQARAPLQTVNFQMQIQHQTNSQEVSSPSLKAVKSRSGKLLSPVALKPPKLDALMANLMKNNPLVIPLGKRVYTVRKKVASDLPNTISTTPASSHKSSNAVAVSSTPVWGSRVSNNNRIRKTARFGQLREIERESDVSQHQLPLKASNQVNGADLRSEYERTSSEIRDSTATNDDDDGDDDGDDADDRNDRNERNEDSFSKTAVRNDFSSTTKSSAQKQLPVQIISWRQAVRHRSPKTHDALQAINQFDESDVQKRTTLAVLDEDVIDQKRISVTTPSYGFRQEREPTTMSSLRATQRPPANQPYVRPSSKNKAIDRKANRLDWTLINKKSTKQASGSQNLIKKSLRLIDTTEHIANERDSSSSTLVGNEVDGSDVDDLNDRRHEADSNEITESTPSIPQTAFTCDNHPNPGYYADIEANCEVFHVCQSDRRKHSFFCPPGTAFNQRLLVCDWKNSVECNNSDRHYPLEDESASASSASIASTVSSIERSAILQPDEELRK